jgi:hypothetical protein
MAYQKTGRPHTGRPRKPIDLEPLETLVAKGCSAEMCGAILGIDHCSHVIFDP